MTCRSCGAELPDGALFCGECGSSVEPTVVRRRVRTDPRVEHDTRVVEPLPAPAVAGPFPDPERAGRPVGVFVLHFSTGARAEVSGTGLLGRRPSAQPGEVFDQVVAVVDESRSVSKTHLEFGVQDGRLWISDRYSGNGSYLTVPGEATVLCEPGRRYRIVTGSRIDIGDVAFVVE